MDMKFKNFLALLYPLMFPVELNKLKTASVPKPFLMATMASETPIQYTIWTCLYTAKNFVKFGGARDTDHPGIRQPSALDIWTNLLFA
ncbi:hypothetical protein NC652_030756 [Populus alba x Populus x berolinensis]|nr:hypothetical protein NC652_030756 [Populus alba x Populus x berolinensis]